MTKKWHSIDVCFLISDRYRTDIDLISCLTINWISNWYQFDIELVNIRFEIAWHQDYDVNTISNYPVGLSKSDIELVTKKWHSIDVCFLIPGQYRMDIEIISYLAISLILNWYSVNTEVDGYRYRNYDTNAMSKCPDWLGKSDANWQPNYAARVTAKTFQGLLPWKLFTVELSLWQI